MRARNARELMPCTSARWLLGLLVAIVAAGCGGEVPVSSGSSADPCDRAAMTFLQHDMAADPDLAICSQDLAVLLLDPNPAAPSAPGAGVGTFEVPIRYTHAQRVTFCVDRFGQYAHHAILMEGDRQILEVAHEACADADVAAGVYRLRVIHGDAGRRGGASTHVFVRPGEVVPGNSSASTDALAILAGPKATPTPNQGLTLLSADCPGCDFRGLDFSYDSLFCGGAHCTVCDSHAHCQDSQSGAVGNLSGTQWAGARMDGISLSSVNLRGATFSDDEFGPVSLKTGNDPYLQDFPINPDFDGSNLEGASFENVDLKQVGRFESTPSLDAATLAGANFRGADLSGVSVSGRNLAGALFDAATRLAGTNFSGADLSGCDLTKVDWTGTNLKRAKLVGAIFDGIDFTKAPYAPVFAAGSTFFSGADLSSASFVGSTLTGLSFSDVTLERANFSQANLQAAKFAPSLDLKGAHLVYADLQNAQMPGVFLGAADEEIAKDPTLAADLSFAYMPGANLAGADLRHVNLSNVHLYGAGASVSGALMGSAIFGEAILSGLNLTSGKLQNANFQSAQLVGSPFNNATLTSVNFVGAHLEGADFTGANMASAKLTNAAVSRRGDFGQMPDQILVYDGKSWTCKPTDAQETSPQDWCGKPTGVWSYTEQNGIPYTITFTETVLNADSTTTCPNSTFGPCVTVEQLTPTSPPFPIVPVCVPSLYVFCP